MVSSTAASEQSVHRKLDSTKALQLLYSNHPLNRTAYSISQKTLITCLLVTEILKIRICVTAFEAAGF